MKLFIWGCLMVLMSCGAAAQTGVVERVLEAPNKIIGMDLMQAINERKSVREFSPKDLDAQTMGDIFYAAFGISHEDKHTVPTARNLHDLAVYGVMADGVWRYMPEQHVLQRVSDVDERVLFETQDFVKGVPLILVYVGKDETWAGMHAGSAYQNVGLYAAARGLNSVVRGYFDKESVAKALKLSADEHVIISQAVGWGKE